MLLSPLKNVGRMSRVPARMFYRQQITAAQMKEPPKERPKRREKPVPASQWSRLTSIGGVALNIGARVIGRSMKETILGSDETTKQNAKMLTPADIEKIVGLLCSVRGAALKVGQILSLQDDSILNPQVRAIFERVRDSADCMPFWQAQKVLSDELGSDWEKKFAVFDKNPFAAASIGQVHKATLHNGREVAVKIQYPGVDRSIDSDINNLQSLVRMWDIVPKGMYIENLMRILRRELKWEVNYIREANCVRKFQKLVAEAPELSDFYVPPVINDLSTRRVLTVEFIRGVTIDKLEKDQVLRDRVGTAIMQLYQNEVYVYRFMQTDPNFANFIYNNDTKKIQLLDFGAARSFGKPFIDSYLRIIMAAAEGDRKKVLDMSRDTGFLTGYETKTMEIAHVESVMALGEALRIDNFDFGRQQAINKCKSYLPTMSKERLTPPPDEVYSMHRKFAGLFMLLSQLGSVVPCRAQFLKILENYKFDALTYTISNMPLDDGNTGLDCTQPTIPK